MREWFHQEAHRVVERAELPPELQQNSPQMRSFLQGVLSDMFDRILNGWEGSSTPATQTPPSQSSRSSIPESAPSGRAINNTLFTVPNIVAGAAIDPSPSLTSRPQSNPFPPSEPLRPLQPLGDIDERQEQHGDVRQHFGTEAIWEQSPTVSENSDFNNSFHSWLPASIQDFELSMLQQDLDLDYFETNLGVSMVESSSAGARV